MEKRHGKHAKGVQQQLKANDTDLAPSHTDSNYYFRLLQISGPSIRKHVCKHLKASTEQLSHVLYEHRVTRLRERGRRTF